MSGALLSPHSSALGAARLPLLSRIARGIRWRVRHEAEYLILVATPLPEAPPFPTGYRLVRISRNDASQATRICAAMKATGESEDPLRRLEQGHECFAWERGGVLAAYGWVCYRGRVFGGRRLADRDGRAFCYQFYTTPEHRGQGLYAALLLHLRHLLGKENVGELVIEVRRDNHPSRQGILRAGFTPVMELVVSTWFRRFRYWSRQTPLDTEIPVVS